MLWFHVCHKFFRCMLSTRRIVGSGTLLVERKFIHGCGRAGHIEDVVVRSSFRGHNLGRSIINRLVQAGKEEGCYKVWFMERGEGENAPMFFSNKWLSKT